MKKVKHSSLMIIAGLGIFLSTISHSCLAQKFPPTWKKTSNDSLISIKETRFSTNSVSLQMGLSNIADYGEIPNFYFEKGLSIIKGKKFVRNYFSLGTGFISSGKYGSAYGLMALAGGQKGRFELNGGIMLPVTESIGQAVFPALHLGFRTKSIQKPLFLRFGIGLPEIMYVGLGVNWGYKGSRK
jgi:hypothetical protein